MGGPTKGARLGSRDTRRYCSLAARLGAAGMLAALLGGCFQPLYGERSPTGGSALRDALGAVDVMQIDAPAGSFESRLAVQIRNDLLFNFTGGGEPRPQSHRLKIQMAGTRATVSLDSNSALPNMENYALNTTYSLIEVGTGKVVVQGRAFATVSYEPPGQQRFARINSLQDAERRAAKVVSDNITTRLASYFVSGT
jgi:LPS-assembly lipoprotein